MNKLIQEFPDGFYHLTEDGDLVGPFKTAEQANIALSAYMRWLDHDHESDLRKMRHLQD